MTTMFASQMDVTGDRLANAAAACSRGKSGVGGAAVCSLSPFTDPDESKYSAKYASMVSPMSQASTDIPELSLDEADMFLTHSPSGDSIPEEDKEDHDVEKGIVPFVSLGYDVEKGMAEVSLGGGLLEHANLAKKARQQMLEEMLAEVNQLRFQSHMIAGTHKLNEMLQDVTALYHEMYGHTTQIEKELAEQIKVVLATDARQEMLEEMLAEVKDMYLQLEIPKGARHDKLSQMLDGVTELYVEMYGRTPNIVEEVTSRVTWIKAYGQEAADRADEEEGSLIEEREEV